jgi:cytochrome c oxidase cbb3-type subunit III
LSKDDKNQVQTTGHEWDGIKELNNPLPKWWVWIFYATIIWSIGYTIAYPAWPLLSGSTPGVLGASTRADVAAEIDRFDGMNAGVKAELASADMATLSSNPDVYNYAIQSGRATFATYCSQCHGSGAAGAAGYPNLLDNDWLWGGDIESIVYTVSHGVRNEDDEDARLSQMPAFGDDYLEPEEIDNVVNYVRSLSGLDGVDAAKAEAGAVVFADNCAACHGEDAKGSLANEIEDTGAPNLADAIWLYGSDYDTVRHNVEVGPYGVMPAWSKNANFDDAKIKAVAAYVYQLGGGQ